MNINDMSKKEIMEAVQGLDEDRAQKIVDACKQKGGIKNLDELKSVPGIDDSVLNQLRNANITAEEEEEAQPV